MGIGQKCLSTVKDQVSRLIEDHWDQIADAYLKREEEEKMAVRVSVSISPSREKSGFTEIESTIAFVRDKVKASTSEEVSEAQDRLPLERKNGKA